MDFIVWILFFLLFIGLPVGIIIFFISSLVLLKKTPKDSENRSKRKTAFIVSSVLAVMFIIVVVALFINADIILEGLFFGIPVGIIVFFTVSLVMWRKTQRDSEKYSSRKTAFIISAVLAGILITAVVSLFIISQMIITYM